MLEDFQVNCLRTPSEDMQDQLQGQDKVITYEAGAMSREVQMLSATGGSDGLAICLRS